ncbi:ribonuclease III [Pseudohongiella nitratireducens]|uniref:ribonuclease III n=1 Tax=Pseudohongiella nitratireducens TaxID=1768907 RepID=UPI0030EE0E1C|tara:strand:+ start:11756 stop:12448 length:693 start_codon:yes stop_codon:yes gene_type:complete
MLASQLSTLQSKLGYRFNDSSLLKQALTHRSVGAQNNQRLEFLGDAALGLIMADILFMHHPSASEGDMSKARASLVNRQALSTLGRKLGINELLVLGLGERKSGGADRDSNLCDAVEAILGAVYKDGGYDACYECVDKLMRDDLPTESLDEIKDAKTRLQEMMQQQGLPLPGYEVATIAGEEHEQKFHVVCRTALSAHTAKGTGSSRRKAEQDAAAAMLTLISESPSGEL